MPSSSCSRASNGALGDAGLRLRAQAAGIALDDRRLGDDGYVEELGRATAGLHCLGILGNEVGERRALGLLQARQVERRRDGADDPRGHDEPAQAHDELREGPGPHGRTTTSRPFWIRRAGGRSIESSQTRTARRSEARCRLSACGSYRYVVADVFTDRPLAGNQLAVFTDAREIPEEQLQPLAREVNFSETVFVYKPEGEGHARVRIFTPTSELPFAGHPVLGTAFVLAGPLQLAEIRLETGAGLVPITLDRDDSGRIVFGRMSQPIPKIEAYDRADELLKAVGVERSELPVELYDLGIRHVYVGLPSEEAVAALEPDLNTLVHLTGIVGVNCFAGSGKRWKNRMFAPGRRRRGGSGDRLGGGAARSAPGPPRPHRLRRRDRDQPGRRGRPPEHAVRPGRGHARPDREGRVRRLARSPSPAASSASRPGPGRHVRGLTPDMSARDDRRRGQHTGLGPGEPARTHDPWPPDRPFRPRPGSDPGRGSSG